jgi:short-subunit dehydrogenase
VIWPRLIEADAIGAGRSSLANDMHVSLKPLGDQVIVITGASSGIGLATARAAAGQGARLVLAARSANALSRLHDELSSTGAQVHVVPADVTRQEDVKNLADQAIQVFGGFDTWINNAGVGMYGRVEQPTLEDMHRLFETNFWGVVHGSLEAIRHLRSRGGALINVGSVVSDRAVPLQGIYAASKHAVKGFTDSLRMELEDEKAPISVTLIKPGAIDTPFSKNAKSFMNSEPQHVPPVYGPEPVANAILYCATTPVRDVFVGGGGKMQAAIGQLAPRLTDWLMESVAIPGMESGRPPRPRDENALDRSSERLATRGDYPGHVRHSSLYTEASLHPVVAGAAVLGLGLILRAALGGGGRRRSVSSWR